MFLAITDKNYEMISGYGAMAAVLILLCLFAIKLIALIRGRMSDKIKLHGILNRAAPARLAGNTSNPLHSAGNTSNPLHSAGNASNPFFEDENDVSEYPSVCRDSKVNIGQRRYVGNTEYNGGINNSNSRSDLVRLQMNGLPISGGINKSSRSDLVRLQMNALLIMAVEKLLDTYKIIETEEKQDFERKRIEAAGLIKKLAGISDKMFNEMTTVELRLSPNEIKPIKSGGQFDGIFPESGGQFDETSLPKFKGLNETNPNKVSEPFIKRGRGRPRKNP